MTDRHESGTIEPMPRRGAPSKILDEATPGSTHADEILNHIRLGVNQRTACALAGISNGTLHKWQLAGARYTALQTQGQLPEPTEEQQAYMAFVSRMKKAYADAEADRLAIIRNAAEGGRTLTKTTTRTSGGKTEVTVSEEEMRPEWTAAAWYLERVHPARYARRVEVTGAGGEPLVPPSEQAATLAASLRAYQQGIADAKETEPADG
jgi:hypothetical protein